MKKIMVGMSGGVDSSVTALLLMEQGYEVVGATFKLFDEDALLETGESRCCSIDDVNDARFVCDAIGIPHYVLNYKELFQSAVVDYFAESYLEGKTPNPCIACNKFIKFDAFIQKALSMGFDGVATGHYAQIEYSEELGKYRLKKALYPEKDQSYVLYHQTQESLSRILMPLGAYSKEQVRELAEKHSLVVSRKPDSQDICFIPDGNYGDFLEKYRSLPMSEGDFVNAQGEVIGKHKGYYHYTVGQRRGLGMGFGKRVYVTQIFPQTNTVVLGEDKDLFKREIEISNVIFIAGSVPLTPLPCTAKLRYSQKEQPAEFHVHGGGDGLLVFNEPQRAPASGQAVVLYDNDYVIGGGDVK